MQKFRSRQVELVFDYKIKGSLKRFVDVMYSITEFKRKVFVLCVKVLSPYIASLFMDRGLGLTILTFCRTVFLSFLKFEQWRM